MSVGHQRQAESGSHEPLEAQVKQSENELQFGELSSTGRRAEDEVPRGGRGLAGGGDAQSEEKRRGSNHRRSVS